MRTAYKQQNIGTKNNYGDCMELRQVTCGTIATNTYFLFEGKSAIVIDPAELNVVNFALDMEGAKIEAVLLTHGHYDHVTCVKQLQERGAKVYIHRGDLGKCTGADMGYYLNANKIEPFTPDVLLEGGEKLNILGIEIDVLHTPGHSGGSVSYIVGDKIFCGDTIFEYGFGRYDFYDGSLEKLKTSIGKLFALRGEYTLYCGHGRETKMSVERKNNPILWS